MLRSQARPFRPALASLGAIVLSWLLLGPAMAARDDHAATIADLIEERARLSTRSERLARETSQMEIEAGKSGPNLLRDVHEFLPNQAGAISERLEVLGRRWFQSLEEAAEEERGRTKSLKDRWINVRIARDAARKQLDEATARASARAGGGRRDWAALALGPLALLALVSHDRRLSLRKGLHRVGCPRLLRLTPALLLAMTAAIWIYREAPSPRAPADVGGSGNAEAAGRDELAALNGDVERLGDLQRRRDAAHREALAGWGKALASAGAGASLVETWRGILGAKRDLEAEIAVQQAFARAIGDDLDEIKRCELALAAHDGAGHPRMSAIDVLADYVIPSACFLGLAALGFADWRHHQIDGSTCPRCLSVGELEEDPAPPGGGPAAPGRIHCEAEWEPGQRCGFLVSERTRYRPRLCFPTLGLTQAGKTRWMAALSGELKHTGATSALFEEVETRGLIVLRRILEEIRAGVRIGRTQVDNLPDPVLYDFVDADFPMRSKAILNLFDYAGEVSQSLDLRHPLRRRMLQADGYFAFLDLTKGPEEQEQIYDGIYRDLWTANRVAVGASSSIPAAICVTKLDILRQDPADAVAEFFERLRRIDLRRRGGEVSPSLIEARSRATARLLREYWPKVNLEDRFRSLFGRRFRFFPMTPFGLESLESTRSATGSGAEPFAVQEPLLWLLHANGYVVFPRGTPCPSRTGAHELA